MQEFEHFIKRSGVAHSWGADWEDLLQIIAKKL